MGKLSLTLFAKGVSPFSVKLSRILLKWPHDMTAGLPQSDWSKRSRQKRYSLSFRPSLGRHMQPFLSYYIGHSHQTWYNMGGDYTRSCILEVFEGHLKGSLPHPFFPKFWHFYYTIILLQTWYRFFLFIYLFIYVKFIGMKLVNKII